MVDSTVEAQHAVDARRVKKEVFMTNTHAHLSRYLFITFLSVAVAPVLVLGLAFYRITSQTLLNNAIQSSQMYMLNNAQRLNAYFENLNERAITLSTDMQLYALFAKQCAPENQPQKSSQMLYDARIISTLLSGYFSPSMGLHSVGIVTKQFEYSHKSMLLPSYAAIKREGLYDLARLANGDVAWIPTYDYIKLLEQPALQSINVDYQTMISAIRFLYMRGIFNGYHTLDLGDEPPLLLLNIKPETLEKMLSFDKQTSFALYGGQGELILSSAQPMPSDVYATKKVSEDNMTSANGKTYITTEAYLDSVGWRIVSAVSLDTIMGNVAYMPDLVLLLTILLAAVAVVLAWRFTRMKAKIDQIVKTSYERELYARDAEIQSLNVQLNPHFLYNTLGSFHYLALENGDKKLSQLVMALCKMLRYTSRHDEEMTLLNDDVKWLQNYLFIMRERDGNRYQTLLDIDKGLLDLRFPKLFLQPLVENALRYAFIDMMENARLSIRGTQKDGFAIFSVEDNGQGMTQEKADHILSGSGDSVGIMNVKRRLELIYHGRATMLILCESHHGVLITIRIPIENSPS